MFEKMKLNWYKGMLKANKEQVLKLCKEQNKLKARIYQLKIDLILKNCHVSFNKYIKNGERK